MATKITKPALNIRALFEKLRGEIKAKREFPLGLKVGNNEFFVKPDGCLVIRNLDTEVLNIHPDGYVRRPNHPKQLVAFGSNLTVAANVYQNLTGGSAQFQKGGLEYDAVLGRFTVPVKGKYSLCYGCSGKTAAIINSGAMGYRVNGGAANGFFYFYGDAYSGNVRKIVQELEAGDYIEILIIGINSHSYTVSLPWAEIELADEFEE